VVNFDQHGPSGERTLDASPRKKGDQMGDDLAFKVGIIGLGLLSSTLLTIAVFSI
jgi:hypothetical protein